MSNSATSNVLAVRNMLGGVDLATALPDPRLTAERFMRVAMTTLQTNEALSRCSPRSIVACLVESAQLGLMPDAAMGEAYLVPFKGNAKLIIGYRGLVKLVRQSGEISTIHAYSVREGDLFKWYLGLNPNVVHTPDFENTNRDNEPITYVYAVAKFRDGGTQFVVMNANEIESIRARSRAGDRGPWVTDYEAMALKTVVRRLAKMLPMSTLAERAMALDGAADAGTQDLNVPQELIRPKVVEATLDPKDDLPDIDPNTGEVVPPPSQD